MNTTSRCLVREEIIFIFLRRLKTRLKTIISYNWLSQNGFLKYNFNVFFLLGDNAAHIAAQQRTVVAAWTGLQERASARKAALLSSNDYHTFMGIVRDLVAWSSTLRR
jgi:hypothetical protein